MVRRRQRAERSFIDAMPLYMDSTISNAAEESRIATDLYAELSSVPGRQRLEN
uniref:hypothetical protein n=1 Tax=Micrococcus sp. V7 TaxID=404582 RepID=UPI001566B17E|nr:hypothetical protein [Micrococcus sp. V7]